MISTLPLPVGGIGVDYRLVTVIITLVAICLFLLVTRRRDNDR